MLQTVRVRWTGKPVRTSPQVSIWGHEAPSPTVITRDGVIETDCYEAARYGAVMHLPGRVNETAIRFANLKADPQTLLIAHCDATPVKIFFRWIGTRGRVLQPCNAWCHMDGHDDWCESCKGTKVIVPREVESTGWNNFYRHDDIWARLRVIDVEKFQRDRGIGVPPGAIVNGDEYILFPPCDVAGALRELFAPALEGEM